MLLALLLLSVEDDESASPVAEGKVLAGVVELDGGDDVLLGDLVGGGLVAEDLGEFVICRGSFIHDFYFRNSMLEENPSMISSVAKFSHTLKV